MVRNILIAFCVILLASCSKDTGSKLFGKWQLQKVEASGDVQNVDTVYFNFEHYVPSVCYGNRFFPPSIWL